MVRRCWPRSPGALPGTWRATPRRRDRGGLAAPSLLPSELAAGRPCGMRLEGCGKAGHDLFSCRPDGAVGVSVARCSRHLGRGERRPEPLEPPPTASNVLLIPFVATRRVWSVPARIGWGISDGAPFYASLVLLAAAPQPEIAPAVPPSHGIALAALGVAVVLILGIWELTGHAIVIAHEGAHAAAAWLLGGVPTSVTFNEKGEGLTNWRGGGDPPGVGGGQGAPLFGAGRGAPPLPPS